MQQLQNGSVASVQPPAAAAESSGDSSESEHEYEVDIERHASGNNNLRSPTGDTSYSVVDVDAHPQLSVLRYKGHTRQTGIMNTRLASNTNVQAIIGDTAKFRQVIDDARLMEERTLPQAAGGPCCSPCQGPGCTTCAVM
jgi:hypothetical protein